MSRRRDLLARRPRSAAAVAALALVGLSAIVAPAALAAPTPPAGRAAAHDASASRAGLEPTDARFSPVSATFVSSSLGWTLGSAPCGDRRCPQLLRTADAGAHWSPMPLPPTVGLGASEQDVVRFADADDGWIYPRVGEPGPTTIWATRDSGAHWSAVDLPVAQRSVEGVEDLEASRGVVTAAVQVDDEVDLFSAPVAGGTWRKRGGPYEIGAGPVPNGEVTLQGPSGWFVEIDRVVVDGARSTAPGVWRRGEPPCSRAGGPVLLTAATPVDVDAVCTEGLWTGDKVSVDLLRSVDGGATFGPARRLPAAVSLLGVAAATGPSSIVVGGSAGATLEMALEISSDGGATWRPVVHLPGSAWLQLGFTTREQGFAILARTGSRPNSLLLTDDGGRSWHAVAFG